MRPMSGNRALREAVLALPQDERADLAVVLLDSLEGPDDEGAEGAWADEIAARVTDYRAGSAEVLSFAEALESARERIKARHG